MARNVGLQGACQRGIKFVQTLRAETRGENIRKNRVGHVGWFGLQRQRNFNSSVLFFFVLINSFLSQNKFCHHRQNVHLQPKLFCKTQHAYHLFTSVTFNINFMCQPFKRLSVSLAISPWQTETLLLFTVGFYLGSLPGSGAIGWGAQLGVQTPHFSGGTHSATEISLWHFSCCPREQSQPLTPLYFLPVLWWCGFSHKSLVVQLLSSQCLVDYLG